MIRIKMVSSLFPVLSKTPTPNHNRALQQSVQQLIGRTRICTEGGPPVRPWAASVHKEEHRQKQCHKESYDQHPAPSRHIPYLEYVEWYKVFQPRNLEKLCCWALSCLGQNASELAYCLWQLNSHLCCWQKPKVIFFSVLSHRKTDLSKTFQTVFQPFSLFRSVCAIWLDVSPEPAYLGRLLNSPPFSSWLFVCFCFLYMQTDILWRRM